MRAFRFLCNFAPAVGFPTGMEGKKELKDVQLDAVYNFTARCLWILHTGPLRGYKLRFRDFDPFIGCSVIKGYCVDYKDKQFPDMWKGISIWVCSDLNAMSNPFVILMYSYSTVSGLFWKKLSQKESKTSICDTQDKQETNYSWVLSFGRQNANTIIQTRNCNNYICIDTLETTDGKQASTSCFSKSSKTQATWHAAWGRLGCFWNNQCIYNHSKDILKLLNALTKKMWLTS